MAREKKWEAFGPTPLLSNGTTDGIIEISSTLGLHTKTILVFKSNTTESVELLEVKKVISRTEFQVGPRGKNIGTFQDMSAFTVSDMSVVWATVQDRPNITPHEIERAEFEEEPVVAKRVINVDELGQLYGQHNPMPVQLKDGAINIGTVNGELEVQLSRKDNDPDNGDVHDAVRIGNQDYELSFTTNHDRSKAAADVIALNRLIDVPHDDVEITAFNADGDPTIIEFREQGSLKLTLTLSYNTEGDLQRVQRTKP